VAEGVKPYRRYRGGRVKGRVPLDRGKRAAPSKSPEPAGQKGRRHWWRWVVLGLVGLLVFLVVWGVLGYLSFSSGVDEANERLPRRAYGQLAEHGSLLSDPATILIIGTDGGKAPGRGDSNRSDSLMLLRTDPEHHRLSYLSIPRDMSVDVPGYGTEKINAANQFGGPALTLATVKQFTGLPIHHVVVVNFDDFKELIDAMGGVTIDVPKPILSNKFDCPYKTAQRCAQWEGWRFAKGEQTMDGRRALVYSRVRSNRLDSSENDLTRGARQQAVAAAVGDELASFGTFLRLPFIGDSLAAPLTTDMSAGDLMKLGWVRFRADSGRSIHCRLGGEPATIGGESVILPGEDNLEVIAMFLRRSAPQPPPKGAQYDGGCRRTPG
jgi:polyisoprenyl-teichoic acid--peptidoglycan teichoic acid transferase